MDLQEQILTNVVCDGLVHYARTYGSGCTEVSGDASTATYEATAGEFRIRATLHHERTDGRDNLTGANIRTFLNETGELKYSAACKPK